MDLDHPNRCLAAPLSQFTEGKELYCRNIAILPAGTPQLEHLLLYQKTEKVSEERLSQSHHQVIIIFCNTKDMEAVMLMETGAQLFNHLICC